MSTPTDKAIEIVIAALQGGAIPFASTNKPEENAVAHATYLMKLLTELSGAIRKLEK